jgi:hypothetical protein
MADDGVGFALVANSQLESSGGVGSGLDYIFS